VVIETYIFKKKKNYRSEIWNVSKEKIIWILWGEKQGQMEPRFKSVSDKKIFVQEELDVNLFFNKWVLSEKKSLYFPK
jgi:hypothetical protein